MNIFLSRFNPGRVQNKEAPTQRLGALLSCEGMVACDRKFVHLEMSRGLIPIYRLRTNELYSPEIQYLNLDHVDSVYFCAPATNFPLKIESQCMTSNYNISNFFGLDPEESEELCVRYVGSVKKNAIDRFCSLWDKCFHLLQSMVRVMVSNEYRLSEQEKKEFSLCWVKCLATARIRFDLECDVDVVDMGVPVPLWLQQFSRGVVILDTPNKMVSSSLASGMSGFLIKNYSDLKELSINLCKSFLMKAKDMPEYAGHQSKIEEWINVCNQMSKRKGKKKKAFSVKIVFGIIGSILLIKAISKNKEKQTVKAEQ